MKEKRSELLYHPNGSALYFPHTRAWAPTDQCRIWYVGPRRALGVVLAIGKTPVMSAFFERN